MAVIFGREQIRMLVQRQILRSTPQVNFVLECLTETLIYSSQEIVRISLIKKSGPPPPLGQDSVGGADSRAVAGLDQLPGAAGHTAPGHHTLQRTWILVSIVYR